MSSPYEMAQRVERVDYSDQLDNDMKNIIEKIKRRSQRSISSAGEYSYMSNRTSIFQQDITSAVLAAEDSLRLREKMKEISRAASKASTRNASLRLKNSLVDPVVSVPPSLFETKSSVVSEMTHDIVYGKDNSTTKKKRPKSPDKADRALSKVKCIENEPPQSSSFLYEAAAYLCDSTCISQHDRAISEADVEVFLGDFEEDTIFSSESGVLASPPIKKKLPFPVSCTYAYDGDVDDDDETTMNGSQLWDDETIEASRRDESFLMGSFWPTFSWGAKKKAITKKRAQLGNCASIDFSESGFSGNDSTVFSDETPLER